MAYRWHYLAPLTASVLLLYLLSEDEARDPGPLTCGQTELQLEDKVVVMTGATGMIGFQMALELARRGARLVLGCRDPHRGRAVRGRIVAATNNSRVSVVGLDLASMRRVSAAAWNIVDKMKVDRVDVLINAAAAPGAGEREVTSEGLERVMATNLLGPLHLATRLLKVFSDDAVVINLVVSEAYITDADIENMDSEESYVAERVYTQSKHLLRLLAREMNQRFSKVKPGLRVHNVEPGSVWSGLHSPLPPSVTRALLWLRLPGHAHQAREAGMTGVWLAGGGARGGDTGGSWRNCQGVRETPSEDRGRLWDRCEELIQGALMG